MKLFSGFLILLLASACFQTQAIKLNKIELSPSNNDCQRMPCLTYVSDPVHSSYNFLMQHRFSNIIYRLTCAKYVWLGAFPESSGTTSPVHRSVSSRFALRSASTFSFSAPSNLSNATFAAYVCGNLTFEVTNVAISVPTISYPLYVLPPCFFEKAANLTVLQLSNVFISANASLSDPLVRLVSAVSDRCIDLAIYHSQLQTAEGTLASIDWDPVVNLLPSLRSWTMDSVRSALPALLPSSLPPSVNSLTIRNCGISGSIPPTLFSNRSALAVFNSFSLDISNNALVGTVPSGLLADFDLTRLTIFVLALNNNKLSGYFPPNLFAAPLSTLGTLLISLDNNNFAGPLSNVFSSMTLTSHRLSTFFLTVSNNSFTGELSSDWLSSSLSATTSFTFSATSNMLSGTIPFDFLSKAGFATPLSQFFLHLENNRIQGDLPAGFLALNSNASAIPAAITMSIFLSSNQLDGNISSTLFDPVAWTTGSSFTFDASSNQLQGDLPHLLLAKSAQIFSVQVRFSNNPALSGTIPSSFLASLSMASTMAVNVVVILDVSSTGLTGALIMPDLTVPYSIQLYASAANFDSISFHENTPKYLLILDVTSNSRLTGTLPSALFSTPSIISILKAGNTNLTGVMPNMGSLLPTSLKTLSLPATSIDFCSGMRTLWNSSHLTSCDLRNTTASTCSFWYPSNCGVAGNCTLSTRPSPDWSCSDNSWVYVGTISSPVFTVPPGSVGVTVYGNVSSPSISFSGIGSILTIFEGCTTNLTSITLDLSSSDLEKLGKGSHNQTLLILDPNASCSSLSAVTLHPSIRGSTCRKVKVETSVSAASFSAILFVDESGCNTWWIILVAVLVPSIVILVVIIVLLVVFVPSVRNFVRPFSSRNAAKSSGIQ